MKLGLLSGAFLALLSLAAVAAPAKEPSGPAVFKAVLADVKGMRGSYFWPRAYVIDQLMLGQSIPDPTVTLPDGNFLVSGCRRHSCDEKSAVIVTPEPKMLAAGLINFHCRPDHSVPRGHSIHIPATCDDLDHPTLTIFVKKKNDRPELTRVLRDWAEREAKVQAFETRIIP
jgi:hypothetical protein